MTGPAIIAVITALAHTVPVRLTKPDDKGDGGPAVVARLSCGAPRNAASGYLRPVSVKHACWKARRRAGILTHVPDYAHRACDQTFGGPESARVTGRIGGRLVKRRLARRDGCEIAEWDALVPLVPEHRVEGLGPSPSG